MEVESLSYYVGKQVKLILQNNYWYKAKVINCSEKDFTFIDIKGKTISVNPSFVMMIEEVD